MTRKVEMQTGSPRQPPERHAGAETPEMAESVSAKCENCGEEGYVMASAYEVDDQEVETYCPECYDEETGGEIHDDIRKAVTDILESHRGVWTNPEFITREHVAKAIHLQTIDGGEEENTSSELVLHPFTGSIRVIADHEHMPSKVEWAAKIHIDGVEDPLWAAYTEDWGIDVEEKKLYWLTDSYQESEETS